MKNHNTLKLIAIISFCFVGMVFLTNQEPAQARNKFVKVFAKTYPDLKPLVKKEKCKICHPGKKKKENNSYGDAMAKVLPKKNVKDEDAIKKALIAIEGEQSEVKDKTFGELIKAGKLPNAK